MMVITLCPVWPIFNKIMWVFRAKTAVVCVVLSLSGCDSWTKQDKDLFTILICAQTADFVTTEYALDHGFKEINPLLGDFPDDTDIVLFKAGAIGLFYVLGEIWPEHRETIYMTGIISGFGAASWNGYQIIEEK